MKERMALIDVYECIEADGDGLDFCHSGHYFEISIESNVPDGEKEASLMNQNRYSFARSLVFHY